MAIKFSDLTQNDATNSGPDTVVQPKKVAFVLPRLGAGGAERVLITLMNNLDRREFSPTLIAVTAEGELRSWVSPSINVIDLKTARVSMGMFALWKTLWTMKPDIIVSTMVHMNLAVLLLRPFLPKTRLIIREAIVPSFFFEQIRFPALMKSLYRFFYPKADLVISPAQIMIDEFKNIAGVKTSNHALLYNPVDIDRMRSKDTIVPARNEQEKNTLHFVCAGRLHNQKGFDQLIDALPFLRTEYNWKLTILGEGEERAALEKQIAERGLTDKVFLPGIVQTPWSIVAAADCFLLPSRWEGLPNVTLESLAVGTPVIATASSGGIAEIARLAPENAVTIVPDMPSMIAAMETMRPNPTKLMRASLLPVTFRLQAVQERFRNLLLGNLEIGYGWYGGELREFSSLHKQENNTVPAKKTERL